MGLSPREIGASSLWQLGQVWSGFVEANSPPDEDADRPQPPSVEQHRAALARIRDVIANEA